MQGIQSSKCPCDFEVWGVSIDAPQFMREVLGVTLTFDPVQYVNYDLHGSSVLRDYVGITNPESKPPKEWTFVPELWERQVDRTWDMYAAKVPASYPAGCGPQFTSSKADNSWSALIDICAQHDQFTIDTTEYNNIYNYKYCFGSRVTYVDGVQTYVTYRYTAIYLGPDSDVGFQGPEYYAPHSTQIGSVCVIDIASQTVRGNYLLEFSDDRYFPGQVGGDSTAMERRLPNIYIPNTFNIEVFTPDDVLTGKQAAANCINLGKDFCTISTYSPDNNYTDWSVLRIEYTGTRKGVSPDMEVFCSPDDVGTTNTGEFMVVLPSCRTYIDSEAEQPDECWVCAKNSGTGTEAKIITSRWLSKIYRSTVDEETGYADGTLSPQEVSNANIILDASNPQPELANETWTDIRIRSYNRVYDPLTGHSTDLVLFTSDTSTSISGERGSPLATFENNDLNTGLPYITGSGGAKSYIIEFETNGSVNGNNWTPDTDDPKNGTYCARTNSNALFAGTTNLSITVNVTQSNSAVSFWYKLDNRGRNVDFPHQIVNQPIVENTLNFYINGIKITGWDNMDFTTESEFISWYYFAYTGMSVGMNTLRWTLDRQIETQQGDLYATLDDIQLPEVLYDDDINGVSRWFYARGKLRRARYWGYAKRNDENNTELISRVNTVPDFITMDKQGRVLYGNPHYLCRINISGTGINSTDSLDETFGGPPSDGAAGGGYVRFTASPNAEFPDQPCYDSNSTENMFQADTEADPQWGSFQILPTEHAIQVRGVNASIRDATKDPILTENYFFSDPPGTGNFDFQQEEFFYDLHANGFWNHRASCWTISEDGLILTPHLEVLWRPTRDQPAWPESEWPNPPYATGFEDASQNAYWASLAGGQRPREIFNLSKRSTKPRWTPINYIIPRGYSDALSQTPQNVWSRVINDPPSDPGDPDWWDPNWESPFGYGPWGSAQWQLGQARFCPCGYRWYAWNQNNTDMTQLCICDDGLPAGTGTTINGRRFEVGQSISTLFWNFTDFDAVDTSCNCC